MKLRLRSFETKETFKLELPNPCTLQNLQETLSQKLPSSSHPSTIYFSLNQKDELTTSSPQESIQSTGITSGDLIYFTTNPNGFSTSPKILPSIPPPAPKSEQPQESQTLIPNPIKQDETPDPNPEETEESMEIDDAGDSVFEPGKSFSVPGFLRKVFTEELGDDSGLNHKLLAIAVCAVLLESGFLEIDPVSKTLKGNNNNNFDIQQNWHLTSFHFTLPDLIATGNTETVKIKFQSLGKFCKVYGSVANGIVHSVLLDEDKLVPFLNVVWANCGQVFETIGENYRVSTIQPEQEVFEFWRKTKDGLALPLLIDLCEKTGLELPPCFIQLPTDLKLKILDSLSGVAIANVSCVCSELRYLASSDELWKQKYFAEFGKYIVSGSETSYKERFAKAWEGRKRRRLSGRSTRRIPFGSFRRNAYFPPNVGGGNQDVWMNVGAHRLRNARLLPDCNF